MPWVSSLVEGKETSNFKTASHISTGPSVLSLLLSCSAYLSPKTETKKQINELSKKHDLKGPLTTWQQGKKQSHHLNDLAEYMSNTNRKKYVDFHNPHADFSFITFFALTLTERYVHKTILDFHDAMYFKIQVGAPLSISTFPGHFPLLENHFCYVIYLEIKLTT